MYPSRRFKLVMIGIILYLNEKKKRNDRIKKNKISRGWSFFEKRVTRFSQGESRMKPLVTHPPHPILRSKNNENHRNKNKIYRWIYIPPIPIDHSSIAHLLLLLLVPVNNHSSPLSFLSFLDSPSNQVRSPTRELSLPWRRRRKKEKRKEEKKKREKKPLPNSSSYRITITKSGTIVPRSTTRSPSRAQGSKRRRSKTNKDHDTAAR